MHRSSIELQNLIEPQKPSFCQTRVTGSTGLNVLSLFDGMSCGQLALQKAGIKVNQYFASEIKPHAIKVTQHNFPNTIQLGSVLDVKASDLPKIDLLIGGSPCQGFSFMGNQLNFEDPRSALFFEYVRILNELKKINPEIKFLLENVKMKKEYQDIISNYLNVEPVEINSKLVSAQLRKRLYWSNISFPLLTDKNIFLNDILEFGSSERNKSFCLLTSYSNRTNSQACVKHYKTCLMCNISFGNHTLYQGTLILL